MSTDRPQRFRYILRKEHIANKKEKGILSRHKTGDEINVLPGTLWEDYEDKQTKKHEKIGFSYFCSLDFENLILSCPPADVTRINQGECELLASISTCADRMKVFEDKSWLGEGLTLDVGSYVHIQRYPNLPEKAPGVIKYKGSLSGIKGLWFGVELLEHRGKGCTNGMFRGHRYFVTDVDSGIFVTIARIRKCPDDTRQTARQNACSPPLATSPRDRRQNYDLKKNERVVWLGDNGPEFGVVRWIGSLPDKPEEVLVGVEFDNAVGSGTGRYKEEQLFRTKPGHASLIPILGLMKEDEYINPTPVKMPIGTSLSGGGSSSLVINSGLQTPPLTSKMPSREQSKSDDEILRDQKSSVSPKSRPREREKKDVLDSSLKHNATSHTTVLSNGKPKGLTPRDAQLKSEKQKKTISFSDKYHNDYVVGRGTSINMPSLSTNASKSIMSRTSRKVDHACEFDMSNTDSFDENEDGKTDHLGLQRSCTLSNSPSAHSALSGISHVLSDISDSDSSSPTETNTTRTTKATIEVHQNFDKDSDRERTKEAVKRQDTEKERIHGSLSPPMGKQDRVMLKNTKKDKISLSQNSTWSGGAAGRPEDIPHDLEIGSMVEVLDNPPKYGVIRWIGTITDASDPSRLIAGLEMEEEDPTVCTDGTFNGRKIFDCPPKKGFFVYLNRVRKDPRFQESPKYIDSTDSMAFGNVDSPEVQGTVPPPTTLKDISAMFGKHKGIQGHHNSCYLDATLFSMYAFTQVFDTILHRPSNDRDLEEYTQIQKVLKESIVNPLRKNFYVRADKVLKLRTLLDKLSSVMGMMGDEKDPEEFLNSLLHDTMKAEPFIKLSSGQESYFYQLFIEKDEKLVLPTTQQLLGLSFLQSDIKLAEIPSCLILQMPRFGKDYKMYQRIVPSLYLDITDILENSPRECAICAELATHECKECYRQFGDNMDKIAFCDNCVKKTHNHPDRVNHRPKPVSVPTEYKAFLSEQKQLLGGDTVRIHRETMELFAVVCIETSHYVAFVKCGPGPKAPWVFFDSMADRMGEQHGYNIPEVQPCTDLPEWLADDNHERILTMKEDRQLPEHARRILCDAYMCMYQSTEAMMYK